MTPQQAGRLDPATHGKGGALLDGQLYREFPDEMGPPAGQSWIDFMETNDR